METPPDRARTSPVYELGEAAQLTGVDPRTISSWFGLGSLGGAWTLLGNGVRGNGRRISFLDLVELDLAGVLMRNGLSDERIRHIRAYADARLDAQYPFARVEMGKICRHADGGDGELDSAHDVAPPLTPELAREIEANARSRFGYTDAWAGFFFPLGRGALLHCDPLVRGGRLTLRSRSLTAELIAEMVDGGQAVAQIVRDYDVAPAEVEAVIEFYADR